MADTKQQAPDLPVYLFTGFLEAGKTKFIQETLEDNRFHKGERTLLLLCEEGEEVYEPDKFCAGNVYVRNIDEESDLTVEHLKALQDEIRPERVLVEYNGMWMLDSLYGNLPEGWAVAQEFLFCDATSFLSYNANMRQLTVDKLKSAELVVLNRYNDSMDRMEMHRVIRAISRRCDIAYEYTDGKVVYDDIEDPLPFDLDAPVVEIEDRDFAIWYRDMSEEPKKYDGKTIEVKCRCLVRKNVPKGCFHLRLGSRRRDPQRRVGHHHGPAGLQVPPRLRPQGPRVHGAVRAGGRKAGRTGGHVLLNARYSVSGSTIPLGIVLPETLFSPARAPQRAESRGGPRTTPPTKTRRGPTSGKGGGRARPTPAQGRPR